MERPIGVADYDCFNYAVAAIDGKFGQGYAKENPALVASYMRSCVEVKLRVRKL